MVEIRPFKAIMYDWDEVDGDPAAVTAPPYDVISDDELKRLKKTSLHNVTRVTMPAPQPGKDPSSRYDKAAKAIKRWKKEGILHRRKEPAFFVYDETHTVAGERRTVRGFFGLLRLDPDYKEVLPHERTHKGPIEDRLELLRATRTDLEPIQFLYADPEGAVRARLDAATQDHKPLVDFTDPTGIEHRMWAVEDPDILEAVETFFDPRRVTIADGHHRYATACQFAKERHEETDDEAPAVYDYKLSLFTAREDPALTVYATYRLVYGLDDPARAREELQERFHTEPLQVDGDAATRAAQLARVTEDVDTDKTHRFVFYWGDGQADVLTLEKSEVDRDALGDHSEAWKDLDVSVLHALVLPGTIGIDDDNAGDHLRYTRIPEEAVAEVDDGTYQVSVFLNPTPLKAVTDVAEAGDYMPQKSTYFQPKSASGLLFSSLS